jgi:hypothetical protein
MSKYNREIVFIQIDCPRELYEKVKKAKGDRSWLDYLEDSLPQGES